MKVKESIEYRFHIDAPDNAIGDAVQFLEDYGFCVVEGIFGEQLCDKAASSLKSVQDQIFAKFSKETLAERKESSIIRLPMKYDPLYFEFLESELFASFVHSFLSESAIVRNYSGQFVYPNEAEKDELAPYFWYHKNFRHVDDCPGLFLDALIAYKDLGVDNGAVIVVPGSHKWKDKPTEKDLEENALMTTLSKGGVLFTDGMLWHKELNNKTDQEMVMAIIQFALPFVKQHIDYPRALGEEVFQSLSTQVKRFMGWDARVPASLEEYYQPLADRSYKNTLPGEE